MTDLDLQKTRYSSLALPPVTRVRPPDSDVEACSDPQGGCLPER